MRKTIFLLAFFFCFLQSKANKIDSLKSDEDVLHFLKPLLQEKYKIDQLEISFSSIENSSSKNGLPNESLRKWNKADFNNDGLTDLFVNIYQSGEKPMILVIIPIINNKYRIINLNQLRSKDEFGYLDKSGKTPLIILNRRIENNKRDTIVADTLQYSNLTDNFSELKKAHATYTIENIAFSTDACFGSCPVFSMKINNKGETNYEATENNPQQGKFKTTLDNKTTDTLFQYLNDIDFADLKDKYSVSWSDQQTATLTITYNQGKTKAIKDYGTKGSFGLIGLYSLLFNLRDTQKWEKAN